MYSHSHSYFGRSSCESEHKHIYKGETTSSLDDPCHVHFIEGFLSPSNGYAHHFKIITGYPIYVNGGKHIHSYHGTTESINGHSHLITGYTKPYYF